MTSASEAAIRSNCACPARALRSAGVRRRRRGLFRQTPDAKQASDLRPEQDSNLRPAASEFMVIRGSTRAFAAQASGECLRERPRNSTCRRLVWHVRGTSSTSGLQVVAAVLVEVHGLARGHVPVPPGGGDGWHRPPPVRPSYKGSSHRDRFRPAHDTYTSHDHGTVQPS